MIVCENKCFSPLPNLTSTSRPVPACGKKHTKHAELRYESEYYGKQPKKKKMASCLSLTIPQMPLFLSVNGNQNSALAPSRKWFNTGSIYIYVALVQSLVTDARKKGLIVSNRYRLGMTKLTNINLEAKRKHSFSSHILTVTWQSANMWAFK